MASDLSAPPVLSTPAEHTFVDDLTLDAQTPRPHRSDAELAHTYEIARTAAEIARNGWRRVALQFPDAMLCDAGWVVDALGRELEGLPLGVANDKGTLETDMNTKTAGGEQRNTGGKGEENEGAEEKSLLKLYVLADTSYSACCVDEIAAEHADADAVLHYGRACLSPTSRLPVFHVFTRQELDYAAVEEAFEQEFGQDKEQRIVLMADVIFQEHIRPISKRLREKGWKHIQATEIVRNPSAIIPNRRLIPSDDEPPDKPPEFDSEQAQDERDLKNYHLFHISNPPTALLLTLSSRLASLHIYSTPSSPYTTSSTSIPDPSRTPALLGRRYGLVIRLATASIIGILVNTLSVQNYLPTITRLKEQIAAAGKKSYTVVVGRLNAAKLANFAEVDGWVVVGCWESGLVEQEGLWKPVVTPFELEIALAGDEKRVWDGSWWGGIEGVSNEKHEERDDHAEAGGEDLTKSTEEVEGGVSDKESAPPEFDLRTGKLISNSRPMRLATRGNFAANGASGPNDSSILETPRTHASDALVQRKMGDLAMVNGVVSPGAQYLRSQRTWQGLGSDFRDTDEDEREFEESTTVEEGRSGVARGYTVGVQDGRT